MKKKVTKTPKKTAVCVCKVGASTSTPKSVSCAAKETLIKASLESVIASPTILKKPNNPRLPAIGTTFIKKFKGKDLMIEVKSDGLYREGKCYKSLSGLAMTITEYPISGYIFFHKEIAEWATKKPPPLAELVKILRAAYPKGSRVVLVQMDDIQAPPLGTKGTVQGVDDIGTIMVHWDNGSHLGVVLGADICRKI